MLALVFLSAAVPLWVSGFNRGRGAFDQHYFHWPTIAGFARELPTPNLSDYGSATAPGYHLLLAAIVRAIGERERAVQVVASVITIGFLMLLGRVLTRRAGGSVGRAVLLGVPVACSMHVLLPGVWLQPDNAAWLGALALLTLALDGRWSGVRALVMGLVLCATVFTRQNFVWCAAIVWMTAWLAPGPGIPTITRSTLRELFSAPARRVQRLTLAVLVTVPAFALIAWLAKLWGGLTPPRFASQHASGANLATPAFALALVGVYSLFLGGWMLPALVRLWREHRGVVLGSGLVGVLLAVVPTTTYVYEQRATGLWNVVGWMDRHGLNLLGRTSPLIVVLAGWGGVAMSGWLTRCSGRDRWLLVGMLLAFIAGQTPNSNAWQRYFEAWLLILLAVMALSGRSRSDGPADVEPGWVGRWRIAGPIGLAAVLAAVTAVSLVRGEALIW